MRRLLCCAKDESFPSEDAVALCHRENRYAVADGASTSYAGRAWARIISRRFVAEPQVDRAWLAGAREGFEARMRPPQSDWLGELAFGRGSFSTLLGFVLTPEAVTGVAIGDTVLFVETSAGWLHHPPLSVEDFADDPVLLASRPGIGALAETEAALVGIAFSLPLDATGPRRCLAMTDALAAWALMDGSTRLERLANIPDRSSLRALVSAEVAAGAMRRDDATLLLIEP